MKLANTLRMSVALAALVAGPALAESADTETEAADLDITQQSEMADGSDAMSTEETGMDGEEMDTQAVAEAATERDETNPVAMGESEMAEAGDMDGMADEIGQMTVGEFVGLPVVNQDGERIGEIDYVIGADNLEAVIGIGGFLGLGEYTVALPIEDFEYRPEERDLMVAQSKEALEQIPEFDETGVEGLDDDVILNDVM